jgi:phenylalanyl-tRNA synthetase alpha chain
MDIIIDEHVDRIRTAPDLQALDQVRVSLLGKAGLITERLKGLGRLSPEERRAAGALINEAKVAIEVAIATRTAFLKMASLEARLASERIDVSMPGRAVDVGVAHPVARTIERMVSIFSRMGYEVSDGPEIEDDEHNFEALNFPPHHPARAMHDTFYFPDGRLLRTHTSPVQVRFMRERKPPLRMLAIGKVYRSDSDQTHSPMFHQMEGLVVDETANFAELKGTLSQFVRAFFERDFDMQFRPSYFPFTEPSCEVDIRWERADGSNAWLEVLGGGMVHPNVLTACGIDPERYTGYAFGLGIERFAMLRYGVSDLRAFYDNDLRFLRQFV